MLKKSGIIFAIGILCIIIFSSSASAAENEKHDVIVIGAGAAGLAAANELQSHDYDVIILEARDRIGGRVFSDTSLDGIPLDVGASWISGTEGNPVTWLAEKYDVENVPTHSEIILYDSQGNKVDDERSEKSYALYCEFLAHRDERRVGISSDEQLQVVVDEFISNHNLEGQALKDFLYQISWNIENDWAGDTSDLSLMYYDKIDYLLEGEETVFPNGYDQIIKSLANDFGEKKIYRNHVVTKIEYGGEGVTIFTNEGTFTGDYVVSTLPLGVLKNNDVEFSPSLHDRKIQAINNLKLGLFDKAYFKFPEVFWDDEYDWINYISDEKGQWATFLNIHKVNGEPILLALTPQPYSVELEKKSDDEIKAEGLGVLKTIYGDKVPEAIEVKVLVTRWGEDPFARGSYSYTPVGANLSDYDALAEPVDNRVFFAGEATTKYFPGLVNGAYVTGIREANRILSIDTGVYLPPLQQQKPDWKQWKQFPEYVICKPDLELVADKNLSPACVKQSTKDRLIEIGWAWQPKESSNTC